jgi:hypothetical protein
VFVTDKDVMRMELNEKQKKQEFVMEIKREACQALHNGMFDIAIEKGLECYHTVVKYYGTEHTDTVYIRILLGEAYTHSVIYSLFNSNTVGNVQFSARNTL